MRSPLGRALVRGLCVSVLAVLSFVGVCFVMASFWGWSATPVAFSRWDLGFVALLGSVAAPAAFVEEAALRREASGGERCAWACGVGVLAALGFVMAYLQISYLYALASNMGFPQALGGVGRGGEKMLGMWSESRTLLCGFAAPFALTAGTRLGKLSLKAQVGVTVAGSLLIFSASLRGFAGLPIVGWLAGSPWAHPIVGTYVYLNPLLFGVALPVIAWAVERKAPLEAGGEELPAG